MLDYKPGFFLSWFLYRLFKRVNLTENMKEYLKKMHREGTVVYAIKYRGQLDYLLYHFNFRRRRLPYPKLAFDLNMSLLLPLRQFLRVVAHYLSYIVRNRHRPSPYQSGFYKSAIKQGTTSLVFLVDPKGFTRYFIHAGEDHLQLLLETQREMDKPIFVVPQLILYKKTTERDYQGLAGTLFGLADQNGVLRKIVLFFRHNRRAFIDFARPLNLKDYLESQPSDRPIPDMAAEIKNTLIDGIDGQKRIILGPIMKSRQEIKEQVLMDPDVSEKMEKLAAGNQKDLLAIRKKAGAYFDEIAADYNSAYIHTLYLLLSWFWKKRFEGVDVNKDGLSRVRDWARKAPLVYVPSHKSHIDYLILNYLLYENHMHPPRIAAGKNLAFWPMGHIFRKCGAFFIRRSFARARLYVDVFNRYIQALLGEGHPIQVYIEGGRSRNGKLMSPKTGFLSILLQAYKEGYCDDLIFVPISIIYDKIMEEKALLKEVSGVAKEAESLGQVVKARRVLKKKYGKIYIRFNEAFSLREYLNGKDPTKKDNQNQLALELVQSINDVTLVTPLSLVATAILANHRRGFQLSELHQTTEILLDFLKRYNALLADTLSDPEAAVKHTLSLLIDGRVVKTLEEGAEETFYYVDEEEKLDLEYYKNCIIHFFVPHAFVAISLLASTEEVKDLESIQADYVFLRTLFKSEFVFNEKEDLKKTIVDASNYFLGASMLSPGGRNGGFRITRQGFDRLPIWAALARTFIESYWIATKAMIQQSQDGAKKTDLLKSMNGLGKRYQKLGIINHIGALSLINFKNASTYIRENVMKTQANSEADAPADEELNMLSQRLYDLFNYR